MGSCLDGTINYGTVDTVMMSFIARDAFVRTNRRAIAMMLGLAIFMSYFLAFVFILVLNDFNV